MYIPPAPPEDEEALFATMAAGINFDKYDEISVEVTGSNPPSHVNAFEDCGFSETVMKNVHSCKYTRPTPVQKYAIPIVKAGRDLMACAQTGSGKTVSGCVGGCTCVCVCVLVGARVCVCINMSVIKFFHIFVACLFILTSIDIYWMKFIK